MRGKEGLPNLGQPEPQLVSGSARKSQVAEGTVQQYLPQISWNSLHQGCQYILKSSGALLVMSITKGSGLVGC